MFKVEKFDRNNEADSVCEELFKERIHITKKGKITKKNAKKNDLNFFYKIKDEIDNILNNNPNLVQQTKPKINKKKPHSQPQQEKQVDPKNKTSFVINNKKEFNNDTERSKKKKHKKKKQQKIENNTVATNPIPKNNKKQKMTENNEIPISLKQRKKEKLRQKLLQTLTTSPVSPKPPKAKNLSLRERMMQRLQAARFRYINEQIYSNDSKEAQKIFKEDPDTFKAYHEGYRQQVSKWPVNPLDIIIKSIQQLPKTLVVADFGCGDAKLSKSVPHKVHSFDLVAVDDEVVPCDMAHVPLQPCSVDVVVFCLSLMGTNLHEYLLEANRVLKPGGILKIAEVESRFDDVKQFIEAVQRFHFKNTWKDLSHNLFYFLDFKKESNIKNKKRLPTLSLNPCLYKKR